MNIVATKVKAKDLKPGDLFSTWGQDYWDGASYRRWRNDVVGERVYIRTTVPCPEEQTDEDVYQITIERGGAE